MARLRRGDEIIALNGEKIFSFEAVAQAETNSAGRPLVLTIKRGEEQLDLSVVPEKPIKPAKATPSIGVLTLVGSTNVAVMAHPTPTEQVKSSVSQIVGTLSVLISPKSEVGVKQLGGAVMIIRVYKNLFENEDGWRLVLWFSVIMNVNLALLNLLPLPVLDGGHITLALIEAVRRRPVSGKILNWVQSGFAVLLITFMVYIAFFDTGDWIRSGRKEPEIVFAPKK